MNSALNNLQWLMFHKTKPNKTKPNQTIFPFCTLSTNCSFIERYVYNPTIEYVYIFFLRILSK